MAPSARIAVLALLAGHWFGVAIRIESAVLSLEADSAVPDKCAMKDVQDAIKCGVDRVIEQITDAVKCGTRWAKYVGECPPYDICPKTCSQEVVRNKTCQILLHCDYELGAHIIGKAPTLSVSNLTFDARVVDFWVRQNNPELNETLEGNRAHILNLLQELVGSGLGEMNEVVGELSTSFKNELVMAIENRVVKEYDWLARMVLGGKGFGEGLLATVGRRFDHIAAEMHSRREVEADDETSQRARLCHRLLRVKMQNGTEYFLRDWHNVLLARTYDRLTDCHSVYSAHCNTGTLIKKKKCPMVEAVVTRYCLFSFWCWKGYRTIESRSMLNMTLYKGREEIASSEDVEVDHIAANDRRTIRNVFNVVEGVRIAEDVQEELQTLVQLKDDELPKVLRNEVCSRLRQNAWTGFKTLVNARCRVMLRFLEKFGDTTVALPIGSEYLNTDLTVQNGVFRAQFIPDWRQASRNADQMILESMRQQNIPLNLTVKEINLNLYGSNTHIHVDVRPVFTGRITEKELKELRELRPTHLIK